MPKLFYFALQSTFLAALIILNQDFLASEPEGIALLITTLVLLAATMVFYLLTGVTDPGHVKNQIFESNYETTELVEDEINEV
mmetsp:Transcript_6639/g.7925  ORF Transcript_6639/g.7925 Transcript_6639/m.7925 type:complete len:83 (+) Transcript_6639:211-459(+)